MHLLRLCTRPVGIADRTEAKVLDSPTSTVPKVHQWGGYRIDGHGAQSGMRQPFHRGALVRRGERDDIRQ